MRHIHSLNPKCNVYLMNHLLSAYIKCTPDDGAYGNPKFSSVLFSIYIYIPKLESIYRDGLYSFFYLFVCFYVRESYEVHV